MEVLDCLVPKKATTVEKGRELRQVQFTIRCVYLIIKNRCLRPTHVLQRKRLDGNCSAWHGGNLRWTKLLTVPPLAECCW